MAREVTSEELCARLRSFGIERDRFKAAVARTTGVTQADFAALDHLSFAGHLTPGQLAERLNLTSGAVTALIDRLERAGWISRTPHPSDRRSHVLALTPAAHETGAREVGPWVADMCAAAATLSAAERQAAARFLDLVTGVAAEHARRRSVAVPGEPHTSEAAI